MTSTRVFKTESLDLVAFLFVKGRTISTTLNPEAPRAIFCTEETDSLFSDIAGFESGASAPAKRLLNARSRFFREASAVVRSGGAR